MKKTLFIFRRDLRLTDNTGLIFALKHAKEVIPCFIFTPQQIEHNPYRSDHCLQFMIESLEDLQEQLKEKKGKLFFFFGEPEEIVKKCIHKLQVDGVVVNRDYTPFSLKRDHKIAAMCRQHKAAFHALDDALLHAPEETVKADGKPYTIFTPFFRRASKLKVEIPAVCRGANFYRHSIPFSEDEIILKKILPKRQLPVEGGRKKAVNILKKLGNFSSYARDRDYPSILGTTHLSAHLKFTTCSPREVFYAIREKLGPHAPLIRSLYWRDFFTSVAFFFPHVFKGAFHPKFDKLKWSYDKKAFRAWCEGKTGVPIVDAAMREMNETGYMHNRARMIAASFLVKDLHIDWRMGEKYFAQRLIDYDPAVNNGNWQWVASTGCDAQPYFRIFNPWIQQKKFDPRCLYIKKWVPELADLDPKAIHNWFRHPSNTKAYHAPIADHEKEAKAAVGFFKMCLR